MERLDQLTALLKSDHTLTVRLLAEQLAVSVRTVTRDIGILRNRDYLRKDIRNFRVDRIRYAHIEEDEFELRDEKSFTREIDRVAAPV
jgi:predicted DNA-binding transcriptional regulator YafY